MQAPRFINLPDWQGRSSKLEKPYAYHVYNPAPVTWLDWNAGAAIIDTDARRNYVMKHIPLIDLDWLKAIHGTRLNGLIESAGKFRRAIEFGLMINHGSALNAHQLSRVSTIEYMRASDPTKRLVTFTARRMPRRGPT